MLSCHPVLKIPRLGLAVSRPNPWFRPYHSAIAKFTTVHSKGNTVSHNTEVRVGGPNESYVYVEPEVGNAIKSLLIQQLGCGVASHPQTLPLQFHHDSHHFAHKSAPLPRVDIFRNLGQSNGNVSPATLWLSGNWHAITPDGSPDATESFERMSRESASELKGALEKLKDS